MTDRHPNRFFHNWLAYRNGDRFLRKYARHYAGELYDLGCGSAPYRDFFLRYADNYHGVDWHNTLHQSQADVISDLNRKIDLDSEVADTLICLSVLEHLNEPQRFLNEAYRILKPGGFMLLQVPWQWHIHEAPYDYFRYTPYGLRHMLVKSGFSDISIEAQSGYFTAATLKFNYFTARTIKDFPALLKYPLSVLALPFWTLGQLFAPLLDKLDRDWERESIGFIITAIK